MSEPNVVAIYSVISTGVGEEIGKRETTYNIERLYCQSFLIIATRENSSGGGGTHISNKANKAIM